MQLVECTTFKCCLATVVGIGQRHPSSGDKCASLIMPEISSTKREVCAVRPIASGTIPNG